ncbi:MAG: 30S ribosomal protein S1 [Alphaproteobacteria bacterium]|nr:30S ribosomal protein S1 [Alphaproteobacteria bacterium]MDA8004899.1 30S ribosomal protein S1 [Alphaproteobacteria bacterium]MDA8006541.1 30S ribosomal protein S1 [Alphaproteobacteria bacterium]MDA8013477.1 30S ribosomal protein S1 [Alphaproteobacteria bacterium]
MVNSSPAEPQNTDPESFAALLESHLPEQSLEGSVLRGTITDFDGDYVVVDVGLKSEGRIPAAEFARAHELNELSAGDTVEVYLEHLESRDGVIVLSRDKARREEAWGRLFKFFDLGEPVNGRIFNRVRGGYVVDLGGAVAFLPASQVDLRPRSDVQHLMDTPLQFKILKMDRARGNMVVSRRAVMEEARAEKFAETMKRIKEGEVFTGVVKNLTEYGAFVDLGGVDGLLHVTDIAWQRVNHPSEKLSVGQEVTVQVTRFNRETKRISLGMKQLEADPWRGVKERFPVEGRFHGRVSNITDYGAFVQLEPGIEGLVHVSEMSWGQRNVHPKKMVSISQEVEVVVLDIDEKRRRISLGMKQTTPNPWALFKETSPEGTEIRGKIKNITTFGLFVELNADLDGMVHLADLSWEQSGEAAIKEYHKGQEVSAKVLSIDVERRRIALGIKQTLADPLEGYEAGVAVTCTVKQVTKNGLEVEVGDSKAPGFIRRGELSRSRDEQQLSRFAPGERIDAKVVSVDRKDRRLSLSIKQLRAEEEEEAIAEYGSAESGAQLGEILGARGRSQLMAMQDDGEGGGEGGAATETAAETAPESETPAETETAPDESAADESAADAAGADEGSGDDSEKSD